MAQVTKDGIIWYVPEGKFQYLPLGGHEERLILWARDRFPHGKQFLDIGANVGLYAIRLAKNFEQIITVEPHPVNNYILRKNIELNNLNNVSMLEVAAWRRADILYFNQMTSDSLAADATVKENSDKNAVVPPFPVLAVPLDDYNFSPDFIKMDIEGGEFEAIYGLIETIKRSKPIMLIEVHQPPTGRTIAEFNDIMISIGYKCTAVQSTWCDFKGTIENRIYEYQQ